MAPQQGYILDRLPVGTVTLDAENRVLSFNDTAAAIFGEEKLHEALGKAIWSVHSPQARDKIEWLLRQAQADGASGVASMLINMPDKVLQLRMIQLKDGGGVSGYCLILYDITDLTAASGEPPPPAGDDAARHRLLFKLPVSMKERTVLLDIDQVAFLRAEGHYTRAHTLDRQFFCTLSLSQLESRLPEKFIRVHRSYIVNIARASGVSYRDDQFVISMEGEPERDIPVSRSNIPRLRRLLGV